MAITDLNAPNDSGYIPIQIREFEQRSMSLFFRFLVSFSLKYDTTDAILQEKEKIKVQYLRSIEFDLFDILKAVRT